MSTGETAVAVQTQTLWYSKVEKSDEGAEPGGACFRGAIGSSPSLEQTSRRRWGMKIVDVDQGSQYLSCKGWNWEKHFRSSSRWRKHGHREPI